MNAQPPPERPRTRAEARARAAEAREPDVQAAEPGEVGDGVDEFTALLERAATDLPAATPILPRTSDIRAGIAVMVARTKRLPSAARKTLSSATAVFAEATRSGRWIRSAGVVVIAGAVLLGGAVVLTATAMLGAGAEVLPDAPEQVSPPVEFAPSPTAPGADLGGPTQTPTPTPTPTETPEAVADPAPPADESGAITTPTPTPAPTPTETAPGNGPPLAERGNRSTAPGHSKPTPTPTP